MTKTLDGMIRSEVKVQTELLLFYEKMKEKAESDFMYEHFEIERKKHEYAIDTLNGVLNLIFS